MRSDFGSTRMGSVHLLAVAAHLRTLAPPPRLRIALPPTLDGS